MGNKQGNDNFSTNYDMVQHNRRMAQFTPLYQNHDLSVSNQPLKNKKLKQQSHLNLTRNSAIFKPTIQIKIDLNQNSFQLNFQYFSQISCELIIFIGVNKINQDETSMMTISVESDYQFKEKIIPSNKQKCTFTYYLNQNTIINKSKLIQKQIIIRIGSLKEWTEYQLRRGNKNQQNWSIVLQKLEIQDKVYEITNIYKGSSEQQCIVCMQKISNTIVKPCNHMCLCKQCAKQLSKSTDKCPICRKNIYEFVAFNNNS